MSVWIIWQCLLKVRNIHCAVRPVSLSLSLSLSLSFSLSFQSGAQWSIPYHRRKSEQRNKNTKVTPELQRMCEDQRRQEWRRPKVKSFFVRATKWHAHAHADNGPPVPLFDLRSVSTLRASHVKLSRNQTRSNKIKRNQGLTLALSRVCRAWS